MISLRAVVGTVIGGYNPLVSFFVLALLMNPFPDLWPQAYIHSLNPFALKITESFGIRWYGLAYLAGFFLGYLFIRWMVSKSDLGFPKSLVSDFVFSAAIGTVIGGRIGYAAFYSPSLFFEFTSSVPFWGLLALHKGGMASHGGIIGLIVACILFAKRYNLNTLTLLDLTTIGGTAGIFLGRIANFINGELLGRIAPPDYRFAVKFPTEITSWPIVARERLPLLDKTVEAIGIDRATWFSYIDRGDIRQLERILTLIVERVQDGSQIILNLLFPTIPGRYPSQLFEAFLEGFAILAILLILWRVPRRPGFIAGAFFIIYPLARFIGESYRLPDIGIGFQMFGLTRGQWLSVFMVIFGGIFALLSSRSSVKKIGGWGAV